MIQMTATMAHRFIASCLRLSFGNTSLSGCVKIQAVVQRCFVTTSSKQARDPLIRKPLSPYIHFVKDKLPVMRHNNPDKPQTEIMSQVAIAWSNISDDEKKHYEDQYQNDKIAYENKMAMLTAEEKQELQEQRKVRKISRAQRRERKEWRKLEKTNPEFKVPKKPPVLIIYAAKQIGIFKSINKKDWEYYHYEFNKLSHKKKETISAMHQKEFEEYKVKKGEWIQRVVLNEDRYMNSHLLTSDIKHELKRLGKPSRPSTSFFCFLRAHEMERGNRSVVEFAKDMTAEWKNLPDSEKQIYQREFQIEKENYRIAVEDWKYEMAELGKDQAVTLMERLLIERRRKTMPLKMSEE